MLKNTRPYWPEESDLLSVHGLRNRVVECFDLLLGDVETTHDALVLERLQSMFISSTLHLPAHSPLVICLQNTQRKQHAMTAQVLNELAHDRMVAAHLIQMAGTATYSTTPCESLEQAVLRVGLKSVKRIAENLGQSHPELVTIGLNEDARRVSTEAVRCAHLCRALAEEMPEGINDGLAFMCGLFAKVGQALFETRLWNSGRNVASMTPALSKTLHHGLSQLAGLYFAMEHGLPAATCESVAFHDKPEKASPTSAPYVWIVWAVNQKIDLKQVVNDPDNLEQLKDSWPPQAPSLEQVIAKTAAIEQASILS